MDQNYSNRQNDFLWGLLANPANDAQFHAVGLQRLVNDFPQSGILQALLAHASDDKNLKQASVYFNAKSLFKLINAPATFTGVPDERIVLQSNLPSSRYYQFNGHTDTPEVEPSHLEDINNNGHENYFNESPAVETEAQHDDNLPAVIHESENLPAITHHEEEQSPHTDTGHHYLADALPLARIIPAAEEFIENKFSAHHEEVQAETHTGNVAEDDDISDFHKQVLAYIHPAEETVENKTEESHESAASNIQQAEDMVEHKAEEAHEGASSYVHQAEDVFEHKTDELHDESASYTHLAAEADDHKTEESHESANAYIHQAEEVVEHKTEESHESANAYIHHAEEVVAHKTDETLQPVASFSESHEETPAETGSHFHTTEEEVKQPEKPIDEEVYDEITGIEQIDTHHVEAHQPAEVIHHEEKPEIAPLQSEPVTPEAASIKAEEDKLIAGGMAASDFFMFNRPQSERKAPEQPITTPLVTPTAEAKTQEATFATAPNVDDAENSDVSKYHDEKLPYSFLWWLDKTRKEHVGIYQPYIEEVKVNTAAVADSNAKSGADELQQQYYENIFHITSVEELDKSTATVSAPFNPPPTQLKKKEAVIIERFIKEEPQIRPQASDKLDNENKAKKSSEDRDELVTETLAAIYSDQMLYHKAIASYKKLILKFPEKSRYFADKIEALEKKTN